MFYLQHQMNKCRNRTIFTLLKGGEVCTYNCERLRLTENLSWRSEMLESKHQSCLWLPYCSHGNFSVCIPQFWNQNETFPIASHIGRLKKKKKERKHLPVSGLEIHIKPCINHPVTHLCHKLLLNHQHHVIPANYPLQVCQLWPGSRLQNRT